MIDHNDDSQFVVGGLAMAKATPTDAVQRGECGIIQEIGAGSSSGFCADTAAELIAQVAQAASVLPGEDEPASQARAIDCGGCEGTVVNDGSPASKKNAAGG